MIHTNRCRSLKFMVERLIKAGHLRRYIREIDREEESAPTASRITIGIVASPESRPTINYILGDHFIKPQKYPTIFIIILLYIPGMN